MESSSVDFRKMRSGSAESADAGPTTERISRFLPRNRPAAAPGNLGSRPAANDPAPLLAAHRAGHIAIETDDADRRVGIVWNDPDFGAPIRGTAICR